MYGARSLMSRHSSRTTTPESHLTILRPTESIPSDVISVFGDIAMGEHDRWSIRAKFICRTLSFCLGPANIWRFPRQASHYGNASYIYLYMIYVWLFGTSLFIFEMGQSQYYSKGFAKLYSICPIMEGITLSMVFHCLIASVLYSMINVYSFLYLFSAFLTPMPPSVCTPHLKKFGCEENSPNDTLSPEYLYFFHYVVSASDIQSNAYINWRNMGILILTSVSICLLILYTVLKIRWVSFTACGTMVLALFYTAAASFTLDGSRKGLRNMFIPRRTDLGSLSTWVYSFEQSLITLGIGAGPLTTLWSTSKLRTISYRECLLMNGFIFLCTMLSGMIFFSAAGAVAHSRNSTIESYFTEEYEGNQIHIVVTEALNTISPGLSNFSVAMFYLLLFLSCSYTLVEYLQIILLYANSFDWIRERNRTRVFIAIFVLFFLVTSISAAEFGHALIMSIDKIFIGSSILFIIACETITMAYFFGMRNLCDDIEFVLGFFPNYYFQITWLILPSLLFLFFIFSMCIKVNDMKNMYDHIMIGVLVATVVMPVLVIAGYRTFKAAANKHFSKLFRPESFEVEPENDESQSHSTRHLSRRQ